MLELTNVLINPCVLLFSIIVIGYFIGKIKICNISFDLSAILIFAVLVGYILSKFRPQVIDFSFTNYMNMFSKLGTSLFISSVGLQSGFSMSYRIKKNNLICLLFGVTMVMTGILLTKIILCFDYNIDKSLLIGVLCGALTSTPGLTTVCESNEINAEFAVLGYGYAYLFGVIGVVMFVQIMNRNKCVEIVGTKENNDVDKKQCDYKKAGELLVIIGIAIALGSLIGNIKLFGLCLGTSGGILIVSILLGLLTKKMKITYDENSFLCFRNFGLMMFFVGVGVPAGTRMTLGFDIKCVIYGFILTILPMVTGYIISKIVFKNIYDTLCVVSGGMTSTPAIGVLIGKSKFNEKLELYSFSYIGALLAMVILVKV